MEDNSMLYLQKPTEASHSLLPSRNPTKRRRPGVDSSRVRINSNDLHKYTRKTESEQQENAIAGDCSEIEVQEQGEGWRTTASRATRTSCMYSPTPSRVDGGSLKPSSAAKQASSKSSERDSSTSNSEDPGSDQASEASSVARRKKFKLEEELKCHQDQQTFSVKDQNRDVVITKTGECLDLDVEKLHQSSWAMNCAEATSSFLNPVYMDNQHVMEIMLMDVQLTVDTSPHTENVPFVSLTSGAYGIAVIGYPLDVGEIRDSSETSLLSKETVPCNDGGSRLNQLVWKTSRRSPVCYVTDQISASISKSVETSILQDGEHGLLREKKSVTKLVKKNRKQFNQEKTSLIKTCVPVELIFSKILAAVNQVQS